jgi:hypothetical protein
MIGSRGEKTAFGVQSHETAFKLMSTAGPHRLVLDEREFNQGVMSSSWQRKRSGLNE